MSLIAGMAFGFAPFLPAAVIVDDSFSDGQWRNDSPTAGARTEPDAAQWYAQRSSTTISIVTDPAGIDSGDALKFGGTTSNISVVGVAPGTLSLGEAGSETDTIILAFDFRLSSFTANTTGLRFGLFDNTQVISADGGASTNYSNKGYVVEFGLGAGSNTVSRFFYESGGSGTMTGGADRTSVGSNFTFGINDNDAHNAIFKIERTDVTSITLSLIIDDVLVSTASHASASVFSYTNMAFYTPGAGEILIDNVSLATAAVPEPSTYALVFGTGALLVAGVRRTLHRGNN